MKSIITALIIIFSNTFLTLNNDAKYTNDIKSPEKFVNHNKNNSLWFAYQVKAQEKTKSMCCWDSMDTKAKQCDLGKKNSSFGSSDSDGITENITVYTKLKKGKIQDMLLVGDECKVNTDNQHVTWLNNIETVKSINWLKQVSLDDNKEIKHQALFVLANHHGETATQTLYDIAKLNNRDISENAVFWLGHKRIDGVEYLSRLYQELPKGKVKKHINFALSQAQSIESLSMLKNIATSDDDNDQRADAYFWLAEKGMAGIEKFLLNAINTDKSNQIKEKAIFGLSQVKSVEAKNILLDLAKNHKDYNIREKALFWLTQNNPLDAKSLLFDILENSQSYQEVNNAVYLISQLSNADNDEILFSLLNNHYSKQVKKQALFWLSQSDNKKTINKLQNIL